MEFLAVVKKMMADSPTRLMFGESDYPAAIKKMCSLMTVSTTGSLFEYDLFEVVAGGYRIVAQKMGNKTVIPEAPVVNVSQETQEAVYTPYSVMRYN